LAKLAASSSPAAPGASGADALRGARFACAEDVDAALGLVLQPAVDWASLSGIVHICALYAGDGGNADAEGEAPLRNILMGAAAPKSLFDWLLLSAVRARASALVNSGASLRAEAGARSPLCAPPFAGALRALRARAGLPPRGALLVVTRGDVDPAWPVFGADAGGGGDGGADGGGDGGGGSGAAAAPSAPADEDDAPAFFTPVVVLPDAAARERVLARFRAAARGDAGAAGPGRRAAAPPQCVVAAELEGGGDGGDGADGASRGAGGGGGLSVPRLLAAVRAAQALDDAAGGEGEGEGGAAAAAAAGPLRRALPRRGHAGAARHLTSVEAGPSVTREFYAGPECPVDWLCLSTYAGPLAPAALGEPVVSRAAVERLFERVAAGSAAGDGGGAWTFGLWRRRRRAGVE